MKSSRKCKKFVIILWFCCSYLLLRHNYLLFYHSANLVRRTVAKTLNITSRLFLVLSCYYSLFADQGLLYAFNMNTGAPIAQVRVGKASHFATPALYGNYIFVGSFKGVAAVIES